MKRPHFWSLVLLVLALVGLGSCEDDSLSKEIIGGWTADTSVLNKLEQQNRMQAKYSALEMNFDDETNGSMEIDCYLPIPNEDMTFLVHVRVILPMVYKIYRRQLTYRPDEEKAHSEVIECTVNGEDIRIMLQKADKNYDQEAVEAAYQEVKKEIEDSVTQSMLRAFRMAGGRGINSGLKIKKGVLMMKNEQGVYYTFHRK